MGNFQYPASLELRKIFQVLPDEDAARHVDLWVIDNDGSNPTQITNDGTYITHATWSPDGNWILYTSYDAQDNKYIHVIRTNGTDKTTLNGFVSNPDWITSSN